jgi:hypothetical protein
MEGSMQKAEVGRQAQCQAGRRFRFASILAGQTMLAGVVC